MASGGGYSGPLVYRQGEGMRPDVGAAFDRMAAAAAGPGIALIVNSGFRSDAEQAALFAAHPDPNWVAPPGHSLHRCATELDLGPESAYGWLAGQRRPLRLRPALLLGGLALRLRRRPGALLGGGQRGRRRRGSATATVARGGGPARLRPGPLPGSAARAAARWNVSAALLAAQLMAESNFDPFACSSAGAQGIAQFIPSTAAAYGLDDPFDPVAAIDAEAHLMSDLIRQFGSPQLALAAYNAGPAPVEACDCVPSIPETTGLREPHPRPAGRRRRAGRCRPSK